MPRLSGPRGLLTDVRTVRRNRQAEDLRVLRKATVAHRTAMNRLDAMRGVEGQEIPVPPKIPGAPDENDQE